MPRTTPTTIFLLPFLPFTGAAVIKRGKAKRSGALRKATGLHFTNHFPRVGPAGDCRGLRRRIVGSVLHNDVGKGEYTDALITLVRMRYVGTNHMPPNAAIVGAP